MRILVIRMLGLGDVACIGVPAVRFLRARHPDAELSVLTFGAGTELLELVPEIDHVLALSKEDWPDAVVESANAFLRHAEAIVERAYDLVINLDTWFMPVFLGRALRDRGVALEGNYLNVSIDEFAGRIRAGTLTQEFVKFPKHYMASTFPNIESWWLSWWKEDPRAYPAYYLNHCCGFEGELDSALDVPADEALRDAAEGRPVVALAGHARTKGRTYPHADRLKDLLGEQGIVVWTGFDGSIPMARTLGRLQVSDLLVSVPSAPQWLAAAVGCPSFLIPGPFDPQPLGPMGSVEPFLDCQFCYQSHCVEDIDFECMKVAPGLVVEKVQELLSARL